MVLQAKQDERRRRRGGEDLRRRPAFSLTGILAWADAFHQRTGRWPKRHSGPVSESPGDTWARVDKALQEGFRGLTGPSSLARLLAEQRGVRNRVALLPFTQEQILAWADAHRRRAGAWPTRNSGAIQDAPGETWYAVEMALALGRRGLPGGSSLPRLLAAHRGVRNPGAPPLLSREQILAWADAHHQRTGQWPVSQSGPIDEAPGETWGAVQAALARGRRGLHGRSSLAELLHAERGVRNSHKLPPLTEEQIIAWAKAHRRRYRRWPSYESGPIPGTVGETWRTVHQALCRGLRGFPGGLSLSQFLVAHGLKKPRDSRLTLSFILYWADLHHRDTGAWPTSSSGKVRHAEGEKWQNLQAALRCGHRGLPRGWTLARLLAERRGVRNRGNLPRLTAAQVLAWADAHHARTGAWPNYRSGRIDEAPGETWTHVDESMRSGHRGFSPGSSLARLLAAQRSVRNKQDQPRFARPQILAWAVSHHQRTGRWPSAKSGPILEAPDENWSKVDAALRDGLRGLPGGSTLAQLLTEQRDAALRR